MSDPTKWTRRLVLQRGLHLGAMGVAAPLAINLAAIGEAAAFDSTDYKALVCVFMYGGNDYANTVVPYDATNYALYHQIRAGAAGEDEAGIALARANLAATALTPVTGHPALTDNLEYALSPRLTGLKSLWDQERLAIQLNVGPLVQPTTLAQYQSTNRVANPLPPKLFSHNDQQSVWQSNGVEGSVTGWGGRISRCRATRRVRCSPASPRRETPCSSRDAMRCSIRSALPARSGSMRSTTTRCAPR
jgi:uncharacterized protein (DUF1501 family)